MKTSKRTAKTTANLIPYTPTDWNESQAAMHSATTMEDALHNACCLAGGWYRRAVTIDMRVTVDNNEEYMLRPSDIAVADGWRPLYELKSVSVN